MRYCTKCGAQMQDTDFACAQCGFSVNQNQGNPNQNYNPNYNQGNNQDYNPNYNQGYNDAPSTGYAVLGFFIPLVGLILYFVEKDKTPLKAKSALKGALWGIGVGVVVSILYSILAAALFSNMFQFLPY
jgi:uncharacterized membrane protein YvbJ